MERKPYVLVKMCHDYSVPETQVTFPSQIVHFPWTDYDSTDATAPIPANLVERIVKRVRDVVPVGIVCVRVHWVYV